MRISTPGFYQAGLRAILDQQSGLAKTQLQLATQKRVLTPSDDPVASTSITALKKDIAVIERYNQNGQKAKGYNEQSDGLLSSATTVLQRIRELAIRVGNGTYTNAEREAIALETEQRLSELLGIANTQNAEGEYLYSGFKTDVLPFTQDAAGNYIYNGDNGQRQLDLSTNVAVGINDSGFAVFQNIKNGNGSFTTAANAANAGSGVLSPGSVINAPVFNAATPQTYTITMVTNAAGELAYNVFGSVDGQIIPALPANPVLNAPTYVENGAISFNGAQVVLTGAPLAGDSFTVQPSTSQDIFTTIQRMVTAMRLPQDNDADRAQFRMGIDQALESLDRGMENIDNISAQVGARLNTIETEIAANSGFSLSAQTTLSALEDLDVAEAITRFNQQQVALEAAQQSFARIQNLSLFRFL
ncbi:flagellar hook-associated protein FlgL [Permianibacter aggregans]|uniref:Flagellar hook-associated protein 3 FlgL n=1 Tax=Permianibacter aggregans TaxID=1510150 RepID=A0A4R6USH6_9GAMM|nr:flagellar hook-associated protein FlgL [Permianibacter aggregans]QGX38295.1 flagellar hook-associated protein 3 [Permianibacter aggregans]TDQ48613.1 flagellar hook-associated protein 3 FlgL [Permianibacter aggregans]